MNRWFQNWEAGMFNSELFYKLCEKYGVELSDKYNRPMIKKEDGTVRPLSDDDILHLLDTSDEEVYLSFGSKRG